MSPVPTPTEEQVDKLHQQLKKEAEECGYHLNPDTEFTRELVKGLMVNERRYGYRNCPCRLSSGLKDQDLDIICPCDYRDPDLTEYGTCYCGLYVSGPAAAGKQAIGSIPERRPNEDERKRMAQERENKTVETSLRNLPFPIWRCQVCGYLCARDNPPEVCPICKASKERFERFF